MNGPETGQKEITVRTLALTVLLAATFVPQATAQFCAPGDEICRVQQANYRLLDSNRHRGWIQQGRADIETAIRQMIYHPSMGWGYYAGGGFIPTPGYTGGGRAARVGRAIEYGSAGAAIGYGATGTTRGLAIGAGAGLAADIVSSAFAGRGSKPKRIDCSKKRLSREDRETCAAVEAEQAAAQRAAEIAANPVWHFNQTRLVLEVRDGTELVCRVPAWGSCKTGQSRNGPFSGVLKFYDSGTGRYEDRPAVIRPSGDASRQGNVYMNVPDSRRNGGV